VKIDVTKGFFLGGFSNAPEYARIFLCHKKTVDIWLIYRGGILGFRNYINEYREHHNNDIPNHIQEAFRNYIDNPFFEIDLAKWIG